MFKMRSSDIFSRLATRIVKVSQSELILVSVLCAVAFFSTANLSAQSPEPPKNSALSTSEIVSRLVAMNEQRAASLQRFTSQRVYDLDYSGFPSHKHARIVVDARFDAPKQKELQIVLEEGSGLLRKRVLRKLVASELEANERSNQAATALTDANYQFSLLGREHMDGRDCYVMAVKPKTKSKFLYDGKIWVDSEDFAVVHIQAQPAKNPSFWIKHVDIEHRYEKVGFFWLPASNRSTSSIRLGGRAALTIDYGSYDVEPKASAQSGSSIPGTMR